MKGELNKRKEGKQGAHRKDDLRAGIPIPVTSVVFVGPFLSSLSKPKSHSLREWPLFFAAILVVLMAEPTGLEPATSDVTGRRSNQLNYDSAFSTARTYATVIGTVGLEPTTSTL